MIRKLKSGEYRLILLKAKILKTNKARNLGTFHTMEEAQKNTNALFNISSATDKQHGPCHLSWKNTRNASH